MGKPPLTSTNKKAGVWVQKSWWASRAIPKENPKCSSPWTRLRAAHGLECGLFRLSFPRCRGAMCHD